MKYKAGDKFVIEIEDVYVDSEDTTEKLYRIRGFNSLVFDEYGLDRLTKIDSTDEIELKEVIDWSKVEVDTPIYVRNYPNANWMPKHFAKYENNKIYSWCNGETSHTADGKTTFWYYAKLAETEGK